MTTAERKPKRPMPRPVDPDKDPSLRPAPIKTRPVVVLKAEELSALRKSIAAGQFDDKERAAYWLEVFRDA